LRAETDSLESLLLKIGIRASRGKVDKWIGCRGALARTTRKRAESDTLTGH